MDRYNIHMKISELHKNLSTLAMSKWSTVVSNKGTEVCADDYIRTILARLVGSSDNNIRNYYKHELANMIALHCFDIITREELKTYYSKWSVLDKAYWCKGVKGSLETPALPAHK